LEKNEENHLLVALSIIVNKKYSLVVYLNTMYDSYLFLSIKSIWISSFIYILRMTLIKKTHVHAYLYVIVLLFFVSVLTSYPFYH